MRDRTRSCLAALLLVGITLAVFWPVRNYEFTNYDDDRYIVQNPHLAEGLSLEGIQWAWTADLFFDSPHTDYWQPLTHLSRMLDIELYGFDAGGHHRMNLLLHLLNVLLLFFLLEKMTGCPKRSACVAAFFAVHPLQVEPVAWITARKDLLSIFFGLLALGAYSEFRRQPSRARKSCVVLLFLMSLLAKPALLMFPFLLSLLDYWPFQRFSLVSFQRREMIQSFTEKWPLWFLSGVFSILPLMRQFQVVGQASGLRALLHYQEYLAKVFYPVGLAIDSGLPEMALKGGPIFGAVLLLVTCSWIFFKVRTSLPALLMGWLWYLGVSLPAVFLLRVANRFMYFSLVGLAILGVWGVGDLLARNRFRGIFQGIGALAIFTALISTSQAQARHWENSITLFEWTLQVYPTNAVAHNQLCAAWSEREDFNRAIAHCSQAVKINPGLERAHYNLGSALFRKGRGEEAVPHYLEAIRLKPDYVAAHSNLGVALAAQGRFDEAVAHFLEALRLKPDSAELHHNLALALAEQGKSEEANAHFREALHLKPDYAEAQANLFKGLRKRTP